MNSILPLQNLQKVTLFANQKQHHQKFPLILNQDNCKLVKNATTSFPISIIAKQLRNYQKLSSGCEKFKRFSLRLELLKFFPIPQNICKQHASTVYKYAEQNSTKVPFISGGSGIRRLTTRPIHRTQRRQGATQFGKTTLCLLCKDFLSLWLIMISVLTLRTCFCYIFSYGEVSFQ